MSGRTRGARDHRGEVGGSVTTELVKHRMHRDVSVGGWRRALVGLRAVEAAQALADLTEISAQIEAVLASEDGTVVGSTFSETEAGERFAEAAAELLGSAAGPEREGLQELVQLQALTPQGCVFVVRDGGHFVAALTGRDRPSGSSSMT